MDNAYVLLARYKLLTEMLGKMTDDEKRLFFTIYGRNDEMEEINRKLSVLQEQAERNKYSFTTDLLANVSGNFISDGVIWVCSQLLKRSTP